MKYILAFFVLYSFSGCGESGVGGGCEYNYYAGSLKIVSMTAASQNMTCDNPIEIVYDFILDDPNMANDYVHKDFSDIGIYDSVSNLVNIPNIESKKMIEYLGLKVGDTFKATRVEEIGSGTCVPVTYDIKDSVFKEKWQNLESNTSLLIPECEKVY